MVIKKKRTYKKQKGGEPTITQPVDRIMIPFFNLIKLFIRNSPVETNNSVSISKDIIKILCNYIDEKIKYSLFVKLSSYLKSIINDIDINTHDMFSLQLFDYLLLEPIMSDKFIDKFLKIYIHILFIEYLFDKENELFKNAILTLLKKINTKNKLIPALNSSPRLYIVQLQQQLRNLFLHDYSTEYGIPVFYGGLLFDSQYNEFVCRQVGASSNKKRNFIINPVLALAYHLFYKLITNKPEIRYILDKIDRLSKINLSLQEFNEKIKYYNDFTELIKDIFRINYPYIFLLISFVIQNFNSKRENNSIILRRLHSPVRQTPEQITRDNYSYLYSNVHVPKLSHVSPNSQFCIVLNQFGIEEIIKYSRFSKCAWTYGCNLKMTPVIRDENISSMHDILSLAQILLLIVLTYGDNIFNDISNVQDFWVDKYINSFYKNLEGQSNNINRNSLISKLKKYQINILVKTLSNLYKDLLIEKISMKLKKLNTSEIDRKLKMIRDELKIKFNSLQYLGNFLLIQQYTICRKNELKLQYFGEELSEILKINKIYKQYKNNFNRNPNWNNYMNKRGPDLY